MSGFPIRVAMLVLFFTAAALFVAGCMDGKAGWGRKEELPPEPPPKPLQSPVPALVDTIGAHALLGSMERQRVHGFGLVVGLGEDGSSNCPTTVREYLIDYLSKQRDARGPRRNRQRVSPARLIDSSNTAVVEVVGLVPPGARKGMRLDVSVEAIPGSETRSLERGLLLPCELRVFDPSAVGKGMVTGTIVARAFGPVFTNPFASDADVRRGFVLGGGYTTEERTIRLVLNEPSFPRARRMERRINERFGHSPKVAEAGSMAFVILHTPTQFAERPERFTEIVTHLYMQGHPAYYEDRLNTLNKMIAEPRAAYEHIALAYEGIGRVAIPRMQSLYSHDNVSVSFYVARSGLRMRDVTALPVMTQIALADENLHRFQAIRELGASDFPQAGLQLAPLLDSEDVEVRVAAYEALREHSHPAIRTRLFPFALDGRHTSFVLDVVDSLGEPMIYVRLTRTPRLVIFGARVPVRIPMFYTHPQQWVTLNAVDDARDITLYGRSRTGAWLSEKISAPPRLVDVITSLAELPVEDDEGRLRGLGLGYAQVIQVLKSLCLDGDGTIPARLVMETRSLTDLLGPAPRRERPETDAAASDAPVLPGRRDVSPAGEPAGTAERLDG